MSFGTIFVLTLLALVVVYVVKAIVIVPQAETRVIERLGKYNRTLESGITFVWPILESSRKITSRSIRQGMDGSVYVRDRETTKIDLREQVYDFPKQQVITRDNVTTSINALLYFQIVDPYKAVYEIDNLPNAIEKLTQTTLRNVVGELELDETLTSRDTINGKLCTVLDEASDKWGVKVTRVELQDITPPASVRDAMERQMQAERERRAQVLKANGDKEAAILESEGKKQSQINYAEAKKQAQILEAEGVAKAKIVQAEAEAAAIEKITEAIKGSGMSPANYMLAEKYIHTLSDMASGKDNKVVYMPYEASSMLSSIGCFKDMFNK